MQEPTEFWLILFDENLGMKAHVGAQIGVNTAFLRPVSAPNSRIGPTGDPVFRRESWKHSQNPL